MTKFAWAIAIGAISAAPLFAVSTPALAQDVDVRIGGSHPGIRVEDHHRRHCRTVTTIIHRHGRTIKETHRRCD